MYMYSGKISICKFSLSRIDLWKREITVSRSRNRIDASLFYIFFSHPFLSFSSLFFLLFLPLSLPLPLAFPFKASLRPVYSPYRQSSSHDNISFYNLPTFNLFYSHAILFSPPIENLHRLSIRKSLQVKKFCCRSSVCQVWSLTLTCCFARYNLTIMIIFRLHNRKYTIKILRDIVHVTRENSLFSRNYSSAIKGTL